MRYNLNMNKTVIIKIQANLFAIFTPNQKKDFEMNEGLLYTENETNEWLDKNSKFGPIDLSEISFGERILVTTVKEGA